MNKEIVEHNRKRAVEAACFELEERLIAEGQSDESVQSQVKELRERLSASDRLLPAHGNDATDSHMISMRKEEEVLRLKAAFGIRDDFVEGEAFDPEAQEARRAARQQEWEERRKQREDRRLEIERSREERERLRLENAKRDDDRRSRARRSDGEGRDRSREADRYYRRRSRSRSRERADRERGVVHREDRYLGRDPDRGRRDEVRERDGPRGRDEVQERGEVPDRRRGWERDGAVRDDSRAPPSPDRRRRPSRFDQLPSESDRSRRSRDRGDFGQGEDVGERRSSRASSRSRSLSTSTSPRSRSSHSSSSFSSRSSSRSRH